MEGRKIAFVTKLCYSSFEDALKVVPKTEDSVKKNCERYQRNSSFSTKRNEIRKNRPQAAKSLLLPAIERIFGWQLD